jgi:hypothetical protein
VPHPSWLAYGFAAVMVTVSVYSIGRLAVSRRWGRRNHTDVTVSHLLMGVAMVGMLVPRWKVLPDGLWEVIFAVNALYFLALSVRFVGRHGFEGTDDDNVHHLSHYLIHVVTGCAMLYMYWLGMPITAPSGIGMSMSGPPTGSGDPGLTLLIIVILIASAVWQLDSVSRFSPRQLALSAVGAGSAGTGSGGSGTSGAGSGQRWLAPRLELACHIAMCVTMGYMLVLMV